MSSKTTCRFNLLLTPEQKGWLIKKAEDFTSCGDVVRSLIKEAMDKDSSDVQNT